MNKIMLNTPLGNSEILIKENGLSKVSDWINKNYPNSRLAIITDKNLDKLFRRQLMSAFPNVNILTVPAKEESKSIEVVKKLLIKLLEKGFVRADILIGFGGGMVTDIAGFVASIYMRGMIFISIPTSLLGMVDAAIGGKTGVNLIAKNIVGTFYPANLILLDPNYLKNLPERELSTGLAEVIKYSATIDASLIDDLEKEKIDLPIIIQKSVKAKTNIVHKDVKEGGIRKVLNFGHTFGHAIEALSDYKLTHGEAISIGMVLANKVAQKLNKQTPETGEKIKNLLKKFNLPTELPNGMTLESLADMMHKDKKMHSGKITFIITPEMGKYEIMELTPEELIELVE